MKSIDPRDSKEPDDPLMREYLNIPTENGMVKPEHRKRMAELRALLKKRQEPQDVLQLINNGFGASHWSDNQGFGR